MAIYTKKWLLHFSIAFENQILIIRKLSSPAELILGMQRFEKSGCNLIFQAGRRQAELKVFRFI